MNSVSFRTFFFALCAATAALPFIHKSSLRPASLSAHEWPATFEGRPLWSLPLSKGEERFNDGFPGVVARFTDGERQFIFRWTTSATRKLHSSADCFCGLGYRVEPESPRMDAQGNHWRCFTANLGAHHLRLLERITDSTSEQSWIDVSAWYWSALLQRSRGPWMAVTVIEEQGAK